MANVLSLRFPRSVEGWLGWVIVLMLAFFSLMSNEFLSIQNLLDLTESYADIRPRLVCGAGYRGD